MCRQTDGSYRVYGAGLLSSVAELQHALVASEKIKRFDPEVTCREECIITAYQNAYYYTDSFEEAKDQMRYVFFKGFYKELQNKFYSFLIEFMRKIFKNHLVYAIIHIRKAWKCCHLLNELQLLCVS